jgi:hypothetical protein
LPYVHGFFSSVAKEIPQGVSLLLYTICSALSEDILASQGEFWVHSSRTATLTCRFGSQRKSGEVERLVMPLILQRLPDKTA